MRFSSFNPQPILKRNSTIPLYTWNGCLVSSVELILRRNKNKGNVFNIFHSFTGKILCSQITVIWVAYCFLSHCGFKSPDQRVVPVVVERILFQKQNRKPLVNGAYLFKLFLQGITISVCLEWTIVPTHSLYSLF